ncbi:MAG: MFS transporter [Burkholderiaceae bacterium]
MNTTPSAPPPFMRDRNFRWLLSGAAISMLGDQFTLIALPWLVLKMTGSTLVLGTVLALVSVPRALFILVGGAVVDQHSPKSVLMLTKHINTVLLGLLAAMVFTDTLNLPMIYAISLAIGVSTAFSIPSATSILPHVVAPEHLKPANGLMLGLRQLSMFLGPLLAGAMIALFGDGSGGNGIHAGGIGVAFAFDAFSFALSAWTLSRVTLRAGPAASPGPKQAVLVSIGEGLAHFWRDVELRACFIYWALLAVLIMGPLHIAIPVLAESRPGLGAAALGLILGAHGAGTLVGMALSGAAPRLRLGSLGITILAADLLVGVLFMPMGSISSPWQGVWLMLVIGALGGFMQVGIFTWIQRRVPPALLGRAMSLFMFIFMGLVPVSAAAAGWVMQWIAPESLFVICGAVLVALSAAALMVPAMRRVDDAPVGSAA